MTVGPLPSRVQAVSPPAHLHRSGAAGLDFAPLDRGGPMTLTRSSARVTRRKECTHG